MRNALLISLLALSLGACSPPMPESDGDASSASSSENSQSDSAATASQGQPDLEALRVALEKNLPGVQVESVRATPLPGVFEIQSGLNFGYVSADGRYLIEGDMNDLQLGTQLTEERRRGARQNLLAKMGDDRSILYAPKEPAKYTVTVFTDIDCGYCRKLHQEIADYNKDGIAVKYLFFPRSGPNTESFYKAEKVWCAEDRQSALTKAKLGGGFEGEKSCANPVMSHLQLAADLGIRGTPAIFLPDGDLIPGYQTPAQLLKVLKEHDTGKAG